MQHEHDAPEPAHGGGRLFPSAEAAHRAADRMRQHATGPLFVVQLAAAAAPGGWLVLTSEEMDRHPRRQDFTSVRQVAPPLSAATTIEVTAVLPGTHDVISLGTLDAAGAMALLEMLEDANGLVVDPAGDVDRPRERMQGPTGYIVQMDGSRPGHLVVRLTFAPRRMADVDTDTGLEDLGLPGGDTHSGPASLVVMLDHWAEEHGYRFVHTAERLNQPIEQYLAGLDPAERQRVVISLEEDDDDGIVRIAEAMPGGDVVEVAALTMDWLASLPPAR